MNPRRNTVMLTMTTAGAYHQQITARDVITTNITPAAPAQAAATLASGKIAFVAPGDEAATVRELIKLRADVHIVTLSRFGLDAQPNGAPQAYQTATQPVEPA